jgi:hypothetical protein
VHVYLYSISSQEVELLGQDRLNLTASAILMYNTRKGSLSRPIGGSDKLSA